MESFELIVNCYSNRIFFRPLPLQKLLSKRGIDFKTAMESNSYVIDNGSLVLTVFIYFLVKALLDY